MSGAETLDTARLLHQERHARREFDDAPHRGRRNPEPLYLVEEVAFPEPQDLAPAEPDAPRPAKQTSARG